MDGEPEPGEVDFRYGDVSGRREAVVIGAGPAGLFAALRLIERGYRPVIVERGKPVAGRKKDIAAINRNLWLDPDSNYAFGEGGAGTFSDGKLYTRSKKRGDYNRALHILVRHGAPPEILYEAHPHIGTDRLPGVITRIRETIEACGGEVIFGARVTGIDVRDGHVAAVKYVRTGSSGAGGDNAASAEDTPGRTGTTRPIASSGIPEKKEKRPNHRVGNYTGNPRGGRIYGRHSGTRPTRIGQGKCRLPWRQPYRHRATDGESWHRSNSRKNHSKYNLPRVRERGQFDRRRRRGYYRSPLPRRRKCRERVRGS